MRLQQVPQHLLIGHQRRARWPAEFFRASTSRRRAAHQQVTRHLDGHRHRDPVLHAGILERTRKIVLPRGMGFEHHTVSTVECMFKL